MGLQVSELPIFFHFTKVRKDGVSGYSQYSIQSWSFWKRKMLCKFNIEQQFRSQSAVDQGRGIDEQRMLNILSLGSTLVKTLQARR